MSNLSSASNVSTASNTNPSIPPVDNRQMVRASIASVLG